MVGGMDSDRMISIFALPIRGLFLSLLLWIRVAVAEVAPGPEADWPMFRGGPALLGVAGGKLVSKPASLWTFKTKGPVKSSPAIVGSQAFVGSSDSNLYALHFETGAKLWSFKSGGEIESSPLVRGGRVFFGATDEIGRAHV